MNNKPISIFKYSFKILSISMIVLLNCIGCGGRINQKENIQTKPNEAPMVIVNSNSLKDGSTQKDDIISNNYRNGITNGLWREYYQNGNLKSEVNYKENKKEGICREWWETGKLWTEGIYVNGKANGIMKWHNEEGVLVATGNMKEDKRDGKWRICDFQIISNCIEANFKNEKKVGIWKILHDNGNVSKEQFWNEGKMVSEKCWDERGNVIKCK